MYYLISHRIGIRVFVDVQDFRSVHRIDVYRDPGIEVHNAAGNDTEEPRKYPVPASAAKRRGSPSPDDTGMFEHIDAVGVGQSEGDILLAEQHGEAPAQIRRQKARRHQAAGAPGGWNSQLNKLIAI
jgi:hypothetical protein